jgi:multicomponent Na+:H+ antiporter subunit G
MTALELAAGAFMVIGCALAFVSGLGLVRLPDVLSRMHAATKPATLGLVFVAVAAIVRLDHNADMTRIVLVVALQFLTAPVGAHLVARAVVFDAERAGRDPAAPDRSRSADDL